MKGTKVKNYFYTNTGRIHITDPCYSGFRDGPQGLIHVLPGRWDASFLEIDGRVGELMIVHESSPTTFESPGWEKIYDDIGVDSGQCGFFDFGGDEPVGGEYGSDDFYGRACEATQSSGYMMGVIAEGAVSCSGYGDGGYPAYIIRDVTGQIVAAKLVFISDEEDEDGGGEEFMFSDSDMGTVEEIL